MITDKLLLANLDYNFAGTKKKVTAYFERLVETEWELEKLKNQKGLAANYDFTQEQKQARGQAHRDNFSLSAREAKEEELTGYISDYQLAKSVLSEEEQIYISESFLGYKSAEEIAQRLQVGGSDSRAFRKLRESAVYKFADFFNLVER